MHIMEIAAQAGRYHPALHEIIVINEPDLKLSESLEGSHKLSFLVCLLSHMELLIKWAFTISTIAR